MKYIEIKDGYKEYILKNKKVVALNNVSIKFEYGKFYAVMGPSGSGKSTLIQVLGCLEELTKGVVIIDSKLTNKMTEKEKNLLRNRKIGFIFQSFYLNNNLNVLENVLLPSYINKELLPKESRKRAMNLLKKLGLEERETHYPNELSGGEQQRVAIARAMINNPDIILADEPTASLDEENERYVYETLKKMSKEGKCIIVVSHNEKIGKFADEIVRIKEGKLC